METNYLIAGEKIGLRKFKTQDESEFITLNKQSQSTHHPWITAPDNAETFAAYLKREEAENFESFAVCELKSNRLIGAFNLSQIVRGLFKSAYLAYYVGTEFEGKGHMSEALRLLLKYIFNDLDLHRLEANIRPENVRSIALVKRCGFIKEGYSPKYLKLDGAWRDHERWAIHYEIWDQAEI